MTDAKETKSSSAQRGPGEVQIGAVLRSPIIFSHIRLVILTEETPRITAEDPFDTSTRIRFEKKQVEIVPAVRGG